MEKIKLNITKDLLSVLSTFSKTASGFYLEVESHLKYDVDKPYSYITDGYRLLALPNMLPIIDNNRESLAVSPIFNWAFYKKYKDCSVTVDDDAYRVYLDDAFIASMHLRPNYPDCSRVLDGSTYDLKLLYLNPLSIYTRLDTINKTIKEFNRIQKLKGLPQYTKKDLKNARVIFSSYVEDGHTFIKAAVDLQDADLEFALSKELGDNLTILDYSLPKGDTVSDFKRGFYYLQLVDCFLTMRKLSGTKYDFRLAIEFDNDNKLAPVKLTLANGAYCILMPIKLN